MQGRRIAVVASLLICVAGVVLAQADARLSDRERIAHALSRLTFGVTPALMAEVEQLGLEAWIDAQLADPRPDGATAELLARMFPTLELTSKQIYEEYVSPPRPEGEETAELRRERERLVNHAQRDLVASIVARAVASRSQLAEVMADFWRNHFNVDRDKDSVRYTATEYDRTVVRDHVFGSFHEMLLSSARHPAMLVYLDNHLSRRPPTKTQLKTVAREVRRRTGSRERGDEAAKIAEQNGLNENYARELLELHTLGVDNGYSQKDVIHVARALTGWTVDRGDWLFQYRDDMHDDGDKFVLGASIPRQKKRLGHVEGERIIRLLARHRNTSEYLAGKLCTWLVADTPPTSLVRSTARVLRESEFDLGKAVRHVVTADEFYDRSVYRSKFKTPFEFVASAIRATGAEVDDPHRLVQVIGEMGQPIYNCEDPTGYRDTAESWRDPGVMALRWRFVLDLVRNRVPGIRVPDSYFAGLEGQGVHVIVRGLAKKMLPEGLRGETVRVMMKVARRWQTEQEQIAVAPKKTKSDGVDSLERRLLGILLGSPEFQEQ